MTKLLSCSCGHHLLRFQSVGALFRSQCTACEAVWEFTKALKQPPTKDAKNVNT